MCHLWQLGDLRQHTTFVEQKSKQTEPKPMTSPLNHLSYSMELENNFFIISPQKTNEKNKLENEKNFFKVILKTFRYISEQS